MKTQLINLKGGAKLLFNRQTEINGINIEFMFKAGSLNDPKGKLGVAHFCEHALCDFANAKMTKKERASYARKFQYRNAYTSRDNMSFIIRTVEEDFDDAIDFLTESFGSIKFLEEDFEEERKIIEDEIKMQLQINNRLTPYINNTEIINDPHFNNCISSPAGTVETFSKISIDDLKEFTKNFITLNNLVICITGNIKKSKALSIIKKYVETRLSVSDESGYEKLELDFFEPSVHFATAIENGKAKIEISYLLKDIPYSYDFIREDSVTTILRAILQEKTFEFFRTENKLCYGCRNYIGITFGHLLNEVAIDCQEENMKSVIEKFGEFIKSCEGDLSMELFNKHKKKVVDSFNFDLQGLDELSYSMYRVYNFRHKLYDDKYKNVWHNELVKVTYDEVNEIYKMLYSVKPHIILVASNEFKDFSYNDIVVTK